MSRVPPNGERPRNIIHSATGGFRERGSLRGPLIRQARVAQGIAALNRVRQEVDDPPGRGRGRGTEPATVGAAADAGVSGECAEAARSALERCRPIPATDLTVEENLCGAQFYKRSFGPPGLRWRGDPQTHLVAAYGPMLEEAALQRCRRLPNPEGVPVCRGYLGVYANFLYIGRARAGLATHRDPHRVPVGPDRRRGNEDARRLPWDRWLRRYGP